MARFKKFLGADRMELEMRIRRAIALLCTVSTLVAPVGCKFIRTVSTTNAASSDAEIVDGGSKSNASVGAGFDHRTWRSVTACVERIPEGASLKLADEGSDFSSPDQPEKESQVSTDGSGTGTGSTANGSGSASADDDKNSEPIPQDELDTVARESSEASGGDLPTEYDGQVISEDAFDTDPGVRAVLATRDPSSVVENPKLQLGLAGDALAVGDNSGEKGPDVERKEYFKLYESLQEASSALSASGSAKVNTWFASVKAKASVTTETMKKSSVMIVVGHAKIAELGPKLNPSNYRLTKAGEDSAKEGKREFLDTCGDSFLLDGIHGSEMYIFALLKITTDKSKSEVKASLKVASKIASLDADATLTKEELAAEKTFDVEVRSSAAEPSKASSFAAAVAAMKTFMSNTRVSETPLAFRLSGYSGVKRADGTTFKGLRGAANLGSVTRLQQDELTYQQAVDGCAALTHDARMVWALPSKEDYFKFYNSPAVTESTKWLWTSTKWSYQKECDMLDRTRVPTPGWYKNCGRNDVKVIYHRQNDRKGGSVDTDPSSMQAVCILRPDAT